MKTKGDQPQKADQHLHKRYSCWGLINVISAPEIVQSSSFLKVKGGAMFD